MQSVLLYLLSYSLGLKKIIFVCRNLNKKKKKRQKQHTNKEKEGSWDFCIILFWSIVYTEQNSISVTNGYS